MRLSSMSLRKSRLFWVISPHHCADTYFYWQSSKETFLLTVIFMHRKIRLLLSVFCTFERKNPKERKEYVVSCIQSLFVVCILSVIVVVKAEAGRRVLRRLSHKKAPTKHIFSSLFRVVIKSASFSSHRNVQNWIARGQQRQSSRPFSSHACSSFLVRSK